MNPPTYCGHTTKRQLRASSNCEIWGSTNIKMYNELISSFNRRGIWTASYTGDVGKKIKKPDLVVCSMYTQDERSVYVCAYLLDTIYIPF